MKDFNKLILHPDFKKIIDELKDKNIFLPNSKEETSPHNPTFQTSGQLLSNIEDIKAYRLDAKNGCKQSKKFTLSAYDESIAKFSALEGAAYFIAHSLILAGESEYIPVNLVTFNFYTRSKSIVARSSYIKEASDPEVESTRDYMRDRINFLLNFTPSGSLLFIDGPLIGGDLYTFLIDQNHKFLEKDILPIYFVKNSISNIVTQHIPDLCGQYNSDMHWVHTQLKAGERSCFFKYEDQVNKKNTKIFCYLKAFESGPQRIELHLDAFNKYSKVIPAVMDLILYLLLVQGSKKNPQLRLIAIAESYARAVLRFIDINKYFREANISPTLNQTRFGR